MHNILTELIVKTEVSEFLPPSKILSFCYGTIFFSFEILEHELVQVFVAKTLSMLNRRRKTSILIRRMGSQLFCKTCVT